MKPKKQKQVYLLIFGPVFWPVQIIAPIKLRGAIKLPDSVVIICIYLLGGCIKIILHYVMEGGVKSDVEYIWPVTSYTQPK